MLALGILQNASTSTDENDRIDIEMQCDMLFIVSSLCDGDTHRKVSKSMVGNSRQMYTSVINFFFFCLVDLL